MKTVTFFQPGESPRVVEYTDNAGDNLIMIFDVDDHIAKGGWALIESAGVAQMIEYPILKRLRR